MSFELDYNKIVRIVKSFIREKGLNLIEAEEIVSESYLKLVESEVGYDLKEFLSLCRKQIWGEKNTFEKTFEGGITASRHRYRGDDCKTCRECKEVLPINSFRDIVLHKANGIIIKQSYCRKCQNKKKTQTPKGGLNIYRENSEDIDTFVRLTIKRINYEKEINRKPNTKVFGIFTL